MARMKTVSPDRGESTYHTGRQFADFALASSMRGEGYVQFSSKDYDAIGDSTRSAACTRKGRLRSKQQQARVHSKH